MRYVRGLGALLGLLLLGTSSAQAGTDVWLMYGWGDNFLGTSSGINQIAARARFIPGVTNVYVRNYWQTQQIANEIMATPAGRKIVVGGYSCGANSMTSIAYGLYGHHRINTVVGIQQSLWCGGYPLYANVDYGQMTYAGCGITFGLGCKKLTAGRGAQGQTFRGVIYNIHRQERHGYADNDPAAQQDVLDAISVTAGNQTRRSLHARCSHHECNSYR